MNIAIINTVAMQRSTGKLAHSLYKHLKNKNYRVRLYYGLKLKGDVEEEDLVYISSPIERIVSAACARLFGNEGLNSYLSTYRLISELKTNKPDIVYLMNLHGYYINLPMLFNYLCKAKSKVVYVLYDEYAFTGKCCFAYDCEKYKETCCDCPEKSQYPKSMFFDNSKRLQALKKASYEKISDITFVGVKHTIERAKTASIIPAQARLIEADEGVDVKHIFCPKSDESIYRKLDIKREKIIILTVAPFSDVRKGGEYFLQLAEHFVDNENYLFIHVGFDGDKTLCPQNLIPVSYVADQYELAAYYSIADLFVCTSLAETIPDTCIEALACGTPILGFDISGIPTCADEEHGVFVTPRSSKELADVVSKTRKKDALTIQSCVDYARSRYDIESYVEKLEFIATKTIS